MKQRTLYIATTNPIYGANGEPVGDLGYKIWSDAALKDFIVEFLFPAGVVPLGAVEYLKARSQRELEYISEYVFTNIASSFDKPVTSSQIKDAINDAIVVGEIDINKLREFDEQEALMWKVAKNDGYRGPFGSVKKR